MKKTISLLVILTIDVIALIISFFTAYFIRVNLIARLLSLENRSFFPVHHFYQFYYLIFVFILIFFYEKLYTRHFNFVSEAIYISRAIIITVVLIAVFLYFSRSQAIFARSILVLLALIGMLFLPLGRWLGKKMLNIFGFPLRKVALLGQWTEIQKNITTLRKLKNFGYQIAGVFCDDWPPADREDAFYLGGLRDVVDIKKKIKLDALFIISPGISRNGLNSLINRYENHFKEINVISDQRYLKTVGVKTSNLDEMLIMRMENKLLSPVNVFLKRLIDLFFSVILMILVLPFFTLIAVLIKLESRGPVLFKQVRFGKNGKTFNLLKFRTMYQDGDRMLADYLKKNSRAKFEWNTFKKLKSHDPRITGIGRFLRRFSLDEFPQLFNILRGDMSFVGPRPYMVREKTEIEKSAAIIFKTSAGLTGLWQIRGRNELCFSERLKLDEFYVRNWSFFLDLIIILKTFGVVIRGRGAY